MRFSYSAFGASCAALLAHGAIDGPCAERCTTRLGGSFDLTAVLLVSAADEITSLPGWEGALPSRQWSGYIEVPGDYGKMM